MKTLSEVKNEFAKMIVKDWPQEVYHPNDLKLFVEKGFDAAIDHLSKIDGGREFWIYKDPHVFNRYSEILEEKPVLDQVHTHVIEHTAYLALQVKLDKAIEAIIHLEKGFPVAQGVHAFVAKTLKQLGCE